MLNDNWIKLKITPDIKQQAEDFASKELESQQYDSLFQTNELKDKTIGHIGQLLFDKYLTDRLIKHELINNLDGISDNGVDFKVGTYTIDVKTAQCKRPINQITSNYRFFIPSQQVENHNTDFYVNIQIDPEQQYGYIIGTVVYHLLDLYPVKQYENNINPAYNVPITELQPIDSWIKYVLKEQPDLKEVSVDEFVF